MTIYYVSAYLPGKLHVYGHEENEVFPRLLYILQIQNIFNTYTFFVLKTQKISLSF